MRNAMKESELERILVREVKKEGGTAYKWISPGNDGVPDRIVIFRGGEIYFVELKSDSGRVRPLQRKQIDRLLELGQYASVVQGMDGLIEFFRETGRGYVANRLEDRYGGEDE
jgi:Holliday junction resolvase